MKIFQYCLIFSILIVNGCGSDSRSSDIYYIQERDVYLRIFDDGEVKKYRCSVNHGYQEDKNFTGKLSEYQMDVTWNDDTYSYIFGVDGSTSEFYLHQDYNSYGFLYERETSGLPDLSTLLKEESIPEDCTNSAVDIVSITPETWMSSSNNNIAVNYDYRGQFDGNLKVQIAYLNDALPSFQNTTFGGEERVEGKSQSNNTLAISLNSLVSSNDALSVYVLMYEVVGSTYKLVSYDNFGLLNVDTSKDVSINTHCLTCEVGEIGFGPFD